MGLTGAEPTPAARLAAFLAARGERTETCETHGAWVVLGDELAYKIKKPVAYGFLDYSTPDRREAMCRAELRIDRAYAPSVYRAVRPLCRDAAGLRPGADGEAGVEDWAVEMRRFDPADTLAAAIAMRAGAGAVELVGERLAALHLAAPRIDRRTATQVRGELDVLFAGLAGDERAPAGARAGERFARAFLAARGEELAARARAGHVREIHGDLRAEHVLLGAAGVEWVDAIEFDPDLRRIDVAEELGFLVMDLHALGAGHLVPRLTAAYRAAGGEPGDDALVAGFAALKAWVRVRVLMLRAEQSTGPAARGARVAAAAHAQVAARLAWPARGVRVFAVGGTAATGKSTLARELGRVTRAPVLSSDRVRKERAGLDARREAGPGLYTAAANASTYRALGRHSARLRAAGRGAVLDATFRHEDDRRALLAADPAGPDLWIECRAPAEVIRARASARLENPERVSDAGPAEALRQAARTPTLAGVPAERWCAVRTDRPIAAILDEVAAIADARLARREE